MLSPAPAQILLTRPTRLDLALGYLHGRVAAAPAPERGQAPRAAFEAAVLRALRRSPCFVSFSGGRDSSAVLAVALDLARRHGLPPPIALTRTYPETSTGYEGDWQETVLRHLGRPEWVRVPSGSSRDALGPVSQAGLLRCGVVWPPLAHDKHAFYAMAQGGSLLTGEGGDEVLGNQRITPVVGTYRRRLRPSRQVVRAVATALAPVPVRRAVLAREHALHRPWLRPCVARTAARLAVEAEAGRPLHWGAAVRELLGRRSPAVGLATLDHVAAHSDVTLHHPFHDPAFVHSFADAGGRWGLLGRAEAMRVLFGDLLPPDVMTRATKARFNDSVFGAGVRSWAREWAGDGIPDDLVDPEALRAEWLSDVPHAGTLLLLHSAWLNWRNPAAGSLCRAYPSPGTTAFDGGG